ncbi:MAG: hypothetical protein Q4C03_05930 [bacterium]|nr:hypothetical protein [bacterium]
MKRFFLCMLSLALTSSLLANEVDKSKVKGYDLLILPPGRVSDVALLPCEECKGLGYTEEALGNLEQLGGVVKKRCTKCKGQKRLKRRRAPQEALDAQKRIRADFDNEQLSLGHQPFAAAYVEKGALEDFTPAELAHLAHQVPETCSKCYGLGFEECRTCDGKGYTEKKAFKTKKRTTKYNTNEEEEETIREACEECNSIGRRPCKKCDGIGLKPLCKKCDGTGLVEKKKKNKTTDKQRITTTEEILCKSCKGTGRK